MRVRISNNYWVFFLLFILILITYVNIFDNELLWDDEVFIVENPDIRSFSNVPGFFVSADNGGLYRPLKSFMLTFTYSIWNLNPFGYHLNSFVLHYVSTILVFLIVSKLFKRRYLALLTSIIFAIHPIHTERVTGITAGFDLLGVVFYLLSFFLYLEFKELKQKRFFYFSSVAFIFSLLSSEEAISLPFLILMYEIVFNSDTFKGIFKKENLKDLFRKTFTYFALFIVYLFFRFLVLGHIGRRSFYVTGDFYTTMLTMSRIIIKYMVLLVFPVNLSLNDRIPHSVSIIDYRVILSVITISLLIYYAFKNLSKNKTISFCIFWFFIALMPFYNIVPIVTLYQERYLYIPSLSICLVFSLIFLWLKKIRKALAIAFLVLVVVFFSIGTITRNNDWETEEGLWEKTIETSPDFPIAYINLGLLYVQQGKEDEALNLFMKALELDKEYALAYNNIGQIYLLNGDYDKAFGLFINATELDPYYPHPYNNLGIIYKYWGNYSRAIEYYRKSISLQEGYYEAHYNLGTLYNEVEEYDKAIPEFLLAVQIRPTYAKAYNNLGISLMNLGRIEDAISAFSMALELRPDYEQARNNLEIGFKVREDLKRQGLYS